MKRNKLRLLLLAVMQFAGWHYSIFAQNPNDSVRIFFHQGKAHIVPKLGANPHSLMRLQQMLTDTLHPATADPILQISGWTSPEGGETLNRRLAEKRAIAIWQYAVKQSTPHTRQQPWRIEVNFKGSDWQRLHELLSNDPLTPCNRETQQLLAELTDSGPSHPDKWLARFKQLAGGRTYAYAYRHLFPALRSATVRLVCLPRAAARRADTVWVVRRDTVYLRDTLRLRDTVFVANRQPADKKPLHLAVTTNLLLDAVTIPNLGVEVMLHKRWSVAANWMYTWMKCDHKHRYWRAYGGELACNRRLGRTPERGNCLAGHHLGVYAQMLTYDVEWGGRGYLGDKWTWGGGLTYGYALPVARCLNLDFTVNVGYLGGIYKEYKPIDEHYVWQRTRRMRWLGPTKVGVHLVWLLGRGNKNA